MRIAVALPDLYSIIFTGRQVVNLETNISGNNTDIIMKATAEMFGGVTHDPDRTVVKGRRPERRPERR